MPGAEKKNPINKFTQPLKTIEKLNLMVPMTFDWMILIALYGGILLLFDANNFSAQELLHIDTNSIQAVTTGTNLS